MWQQMIPNLLQEEKMIFSLEENGLLIVPPVIDMVERFRFQRKWHYENSNITLTVFIHSITLSGGMINDPDRAAPSLTVLLKKQIEMSEYTLESSLSGNNHLPSGDFYFDISICLGLLMAITFLMIRKNRNK